MVQGHCAPLRAGQGRAIRCPGREEGSGFFHSANTTLTGDTAVNFSFIFCTINETAGMQFTTRCHRDLHSFFKVINI